MNTAAVEPAVAQAWTISTTLLVEAASATILYGAFMVLAAFLAGPSRPMVALRRAVAPFVQHPAIAYTAFAVFIGLLLWWAPTPATRDPLLALLLIALLACRRRGAAPPDRPRASRRRHGRRDRAHPRARPAARDWVRQGTSAGRTAVAGTAVASGDRGEDQDVRWRVGRRRRLEQLERLGRLKETGVLDEQEFAAQKRAILAATRAEPEDGAPAPPAAAPGDRRAFASVGRTSTALGGELVAVRSR